MALTPWNDRYQFEMLARDSQYVAFGLSNDNKMVKFTIIKIDVNLIANNIK